MNNIIYSFQFVTLLYDILKFKNNTKILVVVTELFARRMSGCPANAHSLDKIVENTLDQRCPQDTHFSVLLKSKSVKLMRNALIEAAKCSSSTTCK